MLGLVGSFLLRPWELELTGNKTALLKIIAGEKKYYLSVLMFQCINIATACLCLAGLEL